MAFFAALGAKAMAPVLTKAIVTGGLAVGLFAAASLSCPRRNVKIEPVTPRLVKEELDEDEQEIGHTVWISRKQERGSWSSLIPLTDSEDEKSDRESETSNSEDENHDYEREESDSEGEKSDYESEGSDSDNEKSDSEDEKSDKENEESESEEETDDEKNKKTVKNQKTKRHRKSRTQHQGRRSGQNQRSVSSINEGSTCRVETNQTFPAAIFMGLLNVRSLNNKVLRILELIEKKKLDVVCTTETWSKEDTGDAVLRRASPEDFTYCYQARPTRGGGAAIQVSQVLQSVKILFNSKISTFEVAATILQHRDWDEPVLVISLYRRGARGTMYHKFLDEFQDVLFEIFNLCNNVIMTGDFNIWLDDLRRGRKFRCLLQAYELDQHVKEPTHRRGHTLDLVITRNVEVSGLSVQKDGISDHYSVYFSARPGSKNKRQKTKEKKDEDENGQQYKKKKKKKE